MARSARMHLFALVLSGVSSRSQVDRLSLVSGLSLSVCHNTHVGFRVLRGFTHTVSRHPASPTRRQRQSPDTHLLLHPWEEDHVLYRQVSRLNTSNPDAKAELLGSRGASPQYQATPPRESSEN